MYHAGYGFPTAGAGVGAVPSQTQASRPFATATHLPSVGGVLSLLVVAVAITVIFHLLGVRFSVEVRRG